MIDNIELPKEGQPFGEAEMYHLLELPEEKLNHLSSLIASEEKSAVTTSNITTTTTTITAATAATTTTNHHLKRYHHKKVIADKQDDQEKKKPLPVSSKSALDSFFILAAPQVRDLQKEATMMKPVALRKKKS